MENIYFKIPFSWNDLSDKQLVKVSKIFMNTKTTTLFDYELFKVFCGYKWFKFKLHKKIIILFKTRHLLDIKKHYNFIYNKQNLTRFIPVIKVKGKKYFSPADRLTNLSIGELSVCEDLYLGYLRNRKNKAANFGEIYLQHLFAVLYISNKDKFRPCFKKEKLETKVLKIKSISKKHLFTTLLSYKGCREAITNNKKYKHIFPNNKTEEITELKIPVSSGFSDVILSFSGKLFGEYHKTYNTNVYTFLDAYEKALETLEKAPK